MKRILLVMMIGIILSSATAQSTVYVDGDNAKVELKSSLIKIAKLAVKETIKARTDSQITFEYKSGYFTQFIVTYKDSKYFLSVKDEVEIYNIESTRVSDIREAILVEVLKQKES